MDHASAQQSYRRRHLPDLLGVISLRERTSAQEGVPKGREGAPPLLGIDLHTQSLSFELPRAARVPADHSMVSALTSRCTTLVGEKPDLHPPYLQAYSLQQLDFFPR